MLISKYRRLIVVLFSCVIFNSPLQAKETDPCNTIEGQWSGGWRSPYARCSWKMEAIISKNKDAIMLQSHLIPDALFPSGLCDAGTFTMTGSCEKGHIQVKYDSLEIEGTVTENTISFQDGEHDIWLNKKNK